MIDALIYASILLAIGFLCGGVIALGGTAFQSTISDDQYREIRSNMKARK